uniref:FixH family protein n=1 Tax=uncultured Altererythrobacter sp. TaxID=500840 RepID=UPI0026385379|nr:FixH family protein [uncultured Altererythrobacter sp.]
MMPKQARQREFTGRHMLFTMIGGFGIVMAVNFYMASLATSGFGGVIVENTYVASQKFNGWLDEAEKQDALGWSAQPIRADDGHLILQTEGVPEFALASATIRRPLGDLEAGELSFSRMPDGTFRSTTPLADGRWIVRLEMTSAGQSWKKEYRLL